MPTQSVRLAGTRPLQFAVTGPLTSRFDCVALREIEIPGAIANEPLVAAAGGRRSDRARAGRRW